MFTSIAPRYDLLNHVLSMNVDRVWWNRTARIFSDVLAAPGCAGARPVLRHRRHDLRAAPSHEWRRSLVGADFSHAMLVRAEEKSGERKIRWVEADALNLPFASNQFQLVTSAFGFRNLANYDRGLAEIYRVLAPGGEIGILDFGEPKGLIGKVYRLYFKRVLPAIGTMISGVRGPYAYLPASVLRFPSPDEMLQRMRDAGLSRCVVDAVHVWDCGAVSGKEVGKAGISGCVWPPRGFSDRSAMPGLYHYAHYTTALKAVLQTRPPPCTESRADNPRPRNCCSRLVSMV